MTDSDSDRKSARDVIASKNTKTLGLSKLFDKLDFPISLLIPNLISYSEHYFRNLLPKRNLKLLLDLN